MTEQEVVNIALTKGYAAMAINYTRSALEKMYQTIVGSSWGRKSASKHDIAFGVYNYINKMNRAAAFNNDKVYEVHTPEVDGLLSWSLGLQCDVKLAEHNDHYVWLTLTK